MSYTGKTFALGLINVEKIENDMQKYLEEKPEGFFVLEQCSQGEELYLVIHVDRKEIDHDSISAFAKQLGERAAIPQSNRNIYLSLLSDGEEYASFFENTDRAVPTTTLRQKSEVYDGVERIIPRVYLTKYKQL